MLLDMGIKRILKLYIIFGKYSSDKTQWGRFRYKFGNYKDYFRNKIAGVIPEDPERIDRAEFLKVGMQVEGFLFEFFTDYEKAIEWLSEVEPLDDKGRNKLV